jgi:hypothetical protein
VNVVATTESPARRQAAEADVLDAQLSALLESVEAERAERAHVRAETQRSTTPSAAGSRLAGVTAPPRRPRRRSTPTPDRERDARPTVAAPTRGAGFAPKAQPARIPLLGNPAVRETTYYLVAAVILATGLGLLCARILT